MTRFRSGLVLACLVVLPALAGSQDVPAADLRIGWAEFKKAYDARQVTVVDVRTRESFEDGRIPGSISVPLDDVERRAGELKKLGKPIVLYCA